MIKIAVLASGNGSNFKAITEYFQNNSQIQVALLIYDRKDAGCHKIACAFQIPSTHISYQELGKERAEKKILATLKKEDISLTVLAGFMRILSHEFVHNCPTKIINIHPSLLPAFKGMNAIEQAWNAGVNETGVSIHFVNENVDEGEIIIQKSIPIDRNRTLDYLKINIHSLEHDLYPQTIEEVIKIL